jgi:hypothetical protein
MKDASSQSTTATVATTKRAGRGSRRIRSGRRPPSPRKKYGKAPLRRLGLTLIQGEWIFLFLSCGHQLIARKNYEPNKSELYACGMCRAERKPA